MSAGMEGSAADAPPIESQKLADSLARRIKTNLFRTGSNEVAKFLEIAHHPMAQNLIDSELRKILEDDFVSRSRLFKAPIYLSCSLHEPTPEGVRARSLLNKVANFDFATPADLNVVIKRALELALA